MTRMRFAIAVAAILAAAGFGLAAFLHEGDGLESVYRPYSEEPLEDGAAVAATAVSAEGLEEPGALDPVPAPGDDAAGDARRELDPEAELVALTAPLPLDDQGAYVLGVTWDDAAPDQLAVRVLTEGVWQSWFEIDPDGQQSGGDALGNAGGEAAILTDAQAVQFRAVSTREVPDRLTVNLFNGASGEVSTETTDLDTSSFGRSRNTLPAVLPMTASGVPQPVIRLRSEWGARAPLVAADYGEVRGAVIHHTAGSNSYSAAQAPSIIRAIQAYHMDARGWNDIGYNFLVDRYGGIWEGRNGGIDKAVWAAHAAPLNDDTTGVSVMGDFSNVNPTEASYDSLVALLAWKFSLHGIVPNGTLLTEDGALNNILGHREVPGYNTACPGRLINYFPSLRAHILQAQAITPSTLNADVTGDDVGDVFRLEDGVVTFYTSDSAWPDSTSGRLSSVDPELTLEAPGATRAAIVGDVDGNGAADAVTVDADGRMFLHLREGAGFALPIEIADPSDPVLDPELPPPPIADPRAGWGEYASIAGGGDINFDGAPDLAAVDAGGEVTVFPWSTTDPSKLQFARVVARGFVNYQVLGTGSWGTRRISDLLLVGPAGNIVLLEGKGLTGARVIGQISAGWGPSTEFWAVGPGTPGVIAYDPTTERFDYYAWSPQSEWTHLVNPLRPIEDRYQELGGASGVLGAAVGPVPSCTVSSDQCLRTYEHGFISWKRGFGVFVVSGPTSEYVLANLSLTGFPVSDQQDIVDPSGDGTAQQFERGWVHAGPTGTFWSPTAVMTTYLREGWMRGALGWPASEFTCGGPVNRCVQWFAGGLISGPAAGPMEVIPPGPASVYRDAGGTGGELGFPLLSVQTVTDPNGNGVAWKLEHGWIHASARGAFASPSAVMAEYSRQGWLRGWLGWPVGPCVGSPCTQEFAGGTIAVGSDGTARSALAVGNPQIKALYDSLGGMTGTLGAPVKAVQTVVDPHGNGFAQRFVNGWVHSSAAGTFATSNVLMTAYSAQGWLRGPLGWPVEAEVCTAAGCGQRFAGGSLYAPAGAPAYLVPDVSNPQIKALYDSLGGMTGTLGAPVKAVQTVVDPHGNGFAQRFVNGWVHSSAAGTFATSNVLMTAYSAQGWLRGPLGWPVEAEVCTAAGCGQRFAGGSLYAPAGAPAYLVPDVSNPQIKALYDSLGGMTGTLGAPVKAVQTVVDPHGNGFAQRFVNGWVHSSAAGTFATSNVLMTAYSAQGWLRGPLGWPVEAEVCTAAGCGQRFAGGSLYAPAGAPAYLVPAI